MARLFNPDLVIVAPTSEPVPGLHRGHLRWPATLEQGPLRALVNNAAIHWTAPIADETPESLRRIWEVNYLGTFVGLEVWGWGPLSDDPCKGSLFVK